MNHVKRAIIVAPDDGGRIAVFGIPVLRRLVLLGQQLGLETIHVVGDVDPLRPIVSDLLSPKAFHPVEDPEGLDRVLNELALPEAEPVFVLTANEVVDQFSLRRLRDTVTGPGLYCLGTEETERTDPVYVASPGHLPKLLRALWSSNAPDLKILEPVYHIQGASGLPYAIGKGEGQKEISEARLVAALASQTRERDGFLARHLDRRVSRLISRRLAHTQVKPNQITLFNTTVGMAGALFLSRSGYWPQLIGSLLFLFFAVMDGVDGEVSRLTMQESQFGYYLDMITDNVVNVAIFSGIAFGLYHHSGEAIYLKFLFLLMGGFGLCAISVYYNILKRSQDELKRSPRITRFMALLTNSDFAYLVVVCALFHRLSWFLIATTAGTYLFAGVLWAMNLHDKRLLRIKLG